ncbi:hypothetical protein NicSoilE8_41890 (plasmid) [Arthrobacter sp. NicSoilE8]|nr:hypothetical protein NicSoilE8_41890 [Arthrobacter sp. NicSoilE8]
MENDRQYKGADNPVVGASENKPESGEESRAREAEVKALKPLGHGWRWYDPLYIVLRFLQYSWVGKVLPTSWRRLFYQMNHHLLQLHEVKRMRADGPRRFDGPLDIPIDEHVTVPGLWVVDYFPPSLIDELNKAVKVNHWDNRRHSGMGESSAETLKEARQGAGPIWWRIADISSPDAGYSFPDGCREKLPKEFRAVELKGIAIGEGVTAVIAHFHLSQSGAKLLDAVWHQKHQPALAKTKGGFAVAESERWSAFRKTQTARESLHRIARDWLRSRCPGAFAQAREHQPLMDLLVLTKFDPSTGERPGRETEDRLRALGLTESGVTWQTSPELPGFLLEKVRPSFAPVLKERTWALWGNRGTIGAGKDLGHHGFDLEGGIANYVDEHMSDFVVRLGLSEFLELLKAESATMRDSARAHHGKFGRRDLKRLRQRFLTASLDFASIQRDVQQYNSRRWRDREAWFILDYAPWIRRQDVEAGRKPFKPIPVNKDLRKRQNKAAQDLVAFDRSYRDILSTVASLGASIDAFKVQRYAIWIAVTSVIVALVTLWISLLSTNEPLRAWENWVSSICW